MNSFVTFLGFVRKLKCDSIKNFSPIVNWPGHQERGRAWHNVPKLGIPLGNSRIGNSVRKTLDLFDNLYDLIFGRYQDYSCSYIGNRNQIKISFSW